MIYQFFYFENTNQIAEIKKNLVSYPTKHINPSSINIKRIANQHIHLQTFEHLPKLFSAADMFTGDCFRHLTTSDRIVVRIERSCIRKRMRCNCIKRLINSREDGWTSANCIRALRFVKPCGLRLFVSSVKFEFGLVFWLLWSVFCSHVEAVGGQSGQASGGARSYSWSDRKLWTLSTQDHFFAVAMLFSLHFPYIFAYVRGECFFFI